MAFVRVTLVANEAVYLMKSILECFEITEACSCSFHCLKRLHRRVGERTTQLLPSPTSILLGRCSMLFK